MADHWHYKGPIVTITSPWVTLFAEHWIDDRGHELEYWRVERAHSVIVIPLQAAHLLLPRPQFRPGVGTCTLDFPGGRLPEGMSPVEVAPLLLGKELGLAAGAIASLEALNETGWIINSSFSNQLLYGVIAHIRETAAVDPAMLGERVACDKAGIKALLARLDCLQCRAVLQAFYLQRY